MKSLFLAIAIGFASYTQAQISTINLQASGLTCSMCSNAISKALKTLPFAENVTADIKNSSFNINIKPGSNVSFDDVKKKVEGAGFSISNLKATLQFKNANIGSDEHIKANGMVLHFLNVPSKTINGTTTIQILDKGFVPAKTYKANTVFTKMDCYKTGVAASCCSKDGIAAGTRVYHVTI
ncbi:heavy-metal-associated domain-containing protein [Ferruginibacter yonginensis]|uniref:Heavy-metal-associated domain-containing protein n=1 Tax=Ferruginibacter yonginensis TaxID=1310416 RepID=A0ABV8QQ13_9BACT